MPETENRALWLTVKQFASVAGVSTQRIYQRLAKDLQSYYQEQNGSKYIDFQALSLFGMDIESPDLQNTCKELAKDLQTPCKGIAKPLQSLPSPTEQSALAALQSVIDSQRARIAELESDAIHAANHRQRAEQAHEELRARAEQMHRERDALRAELDGEKARAAEIAAERDRLGAIVDRLTATIQADAAARALTAKESQAAIETAAQTAEQGDGTQSEQPAADQSEGAAPVKRGLFARLFKRKPSG